MTNSEPCVMTDARDGALWMTLNRPAAMNAITPDLVALLDEALNRVEHDNDLRSVVLTGNGRAFCAGADLKHVRQTTSGDPDAMGAFLHSVLALMERLEKFPKPVIAAVNGLALAGGLELVLCCDLVLAARSAKLGDAHANYGLLPGGGSSVRLPRKIGPTRAKYLLFTGEFMPADTLMDWGLVNEVFEDDALMDGAQQLVSRLSEKSPLVLRRMKGLVDDGLEQPSATALRLELLASEVHAHSYDMKEGLAAFEQKRKPAFQGR